MAPRVEKLARLEQAGIDPFPRRFARTHTAQAVLAAFDTPGPQQERCVRLAGRIVTMRHMGRLTFAHLQDGSGRIQIAFRADVLGPERYALLRDLDLGDFIGVEGRPFVTRTGERTVEVHEATLLAKAVRPLPEKWHGLADVEKRYRQRYLDLIVNEDVRRAFELRARVVQAMRDFLNARGFLEVETPVLQPLYGGAAARPFETYHHALDRKLFLRIATELYLKRLVVGGFDMVYEIGKDFRDEGLSTKHNPEFTMMESYEAYADYRDVMAMTEEMVAFIAQQAIGTTRIVFRANDIDLAPPWRRATLRELILEHAGVDYRAHPERDELYRAAITAGARPAPHATWAKLVDELLATFVEPRLLQPTFVIDYPLALSPFAKRRADDFGTVERFEAFVGGIEIANAFTELNDPRDQYQRFKEQLAQRAAGDEEAQQFDEDFLVALEHGMPPTGGLGMGIDRLVMLLTDQHSIRDVILFPQLRSKD
ncbi:MAG: lysine--tRNA ligase [Chloroflexi bacterium]|nr:lysine--tRNA ligase [Chloroflexota bacterium]